MPERDNGGAVVSAAHYDTRDGDCGITELMIIRGDGAWPRSATRTAMDLDLTVVGMSTPSRGSTNPYTATPGGVATVCQRAVQQHH